MAETLNRTACNKLEEIFGCFLQSIILITVLRCPSQSLTSHTLDFIIAQMQDGYPPPRLPYTKTPRASLQNQSSK